MYHITAWILFESGTTRIRLLILNCRKQNNIFSKILLVCQAFRYHRTGNAASEIDTKSAVGISFRKVNCHNFFGGYEDFI